MLCGAAPFAPPIATMHSPHSWNHVLYAVLAMLVAATLAPGVASTVVSGCAGAASATEANGFFTISGSGVSGVNGCYAMKYDNGQDSPGNTCRNQCAVGGLRCRDGSVDSTADCSAAVDWYLASSARRAEISPTVEYKTTTTRGGDESTEVSTLSVTRE